MTVKIAGIWELGWNTPIKEIDLWYYCLTDFGIESFYMTPITGIKSPWVIEKDTFEEILKENKDYTYVFVDERTENTLTDFVHPEKALYIFGRVNTGSYFHLMRKKDLTVKINTPENKATLWPHQVAGIILYDRFIKWQSQ
jgi:hypothetical protein